MSDDIVMDFQRFDRIGLEEAVYCAGKSPDQIGAALGLAAGRGAGLLLTRLDADKHAALPSVWRDQIDYDGVSRTGFFGPVRAVEGSGLVAIVAAGSSDTGVAREAQRTLRYAGQEAGIVADVGVAGLWRLQDRLAEIRACPIVIVVAGMDAALASVIGGLVAGPVICVPTSVGYGVAKGGGTALNAMLASCAPGITVCNIDNGYGAAAAALRFANSAGRIGASN